MATVMLMLVVSLSLPALSVQQCPNIYVTDVSGTYPEIINLSPFAPNIDIKATNGTQKVPETATIGYSVFTVVWPDATAVLVSDNMGFGNTFTHTLNENKNISVKVNTSLIGFVDYIDSNLKNYFSNAFELRFDGNPQVCSLKIDLGISDSNTQAPTFDKDSYSVNVIENYPKGVLLSDLKVKASDKDSETPNNKFYVVVEFGCPLEQLGGGQQDVSAPNGDLTDVFFQLNRKVNHNTEPSISCTVYLQDRGNPGLRGSNTIITITVAVSNDQPPKFDYQYYYTTAISAQAQETPLDVTPATIHAVDPDGTGAVIYSMTDAKTEVPGINYFNIDSRTAAITVAKDMDEVFLKNQRAVFIVTANDTSGDTDIAFLEIELPPIPTTTPEPTTTPTTTTTTTPTTTTATEGATCPTCPPCVTTTAPPVTGRVTFTKATYAMEIYTTFQSVGRVNILEDTEVIYSWETDSTQFYLDSVTGEITMKQIPTSLGFYELTAVATATSGLLKDTAQVKINVIPSSDGPDVPVISYSVMSRVVTENDATWRVKVVATPTAGTFCILSARSDKMEDMRGYFDISVDGDLTLVSGQLLDREKVAKVTVKVQAFGDPGVTCPTDNDSQDLFRSQALVTLTVTDVNDNSPEFVVPLDSATIAYPRDSSLQSVVGPVIALQATDADQNPSLIYSLKGADAAKFDVEADSGLVFVQNLFSCNPSCSLQAVVSDSMTESVVNIKILEVDIDHIFTLTLATEVSQVDEELAIISNKIGLQVSSIFVSPSIQASSRSYVRTFGRTRTSRANTAWMLSVHVYSLDPTTGQLLTLDEFNTKLSSNTEYKAEEFTEKATFQPTTGVTTADVTGYQVAVGILGALLGIILVAALVYWGLKRRHGKSSPPASSSKTYDAAQTNKSYVSNEKQDTHDGGSIKHVPIYQNGGVAGYDQGLSESPPLVASNFLQQRSPEPPPPSGLRRIEPGPPPLTHDPLTSYVNSTYPEARPQNNPSAPPLRSSFSSMHQPPGTGPSSAPPGPSIYAKPPNKGTLVTKPPKKEPLASSAAPAKSILKGPDILPMSPMPKEPRKDYDEPITAAPVFSKAKDSSPPPKKRTSSGLDALENPNKTNEADNKKSNLKQTDKIDKSPSSDDDTKSVVFKLMVDQKTIVPENEGPAAKAQRKQEEKIKAMQESSSDSDTNEENEKM